eukprot:m.55108 g.55108  ORF g.55108 m.55108 type:complete len:203 (+) comp16856_c0_seq1:176-784(+)
MAEVVTERWVVYTDRDPFSEDADEDLYSDNEEPTGPDSGQKHHRVASVMLRPSRLGVGDDTGVDGNGNARPRSRVFTAFLTEAQKKAAEVVIDSVNVESEKVVFRNATDADVSLKGWSCKARASGKQSAPFPEACVVRARATITLWMMGAANPDAPQTDDEHSVLWRNKMGKPRRLPVISKGGDAIELLNDQGATVSFHQIL